MGCIVSRIFLDFYIFFIFTRPLTRCILYIVLKTDGNYLPYSDLYSFDGSRLEGWGAGTPSHDTSNGCWNNWFFIYRIELRDAPFNMHDEL